MLVDTDVQFMVHLGDLVNRLNDQIIAAGDLITGDVLGDSVKPRIGAWMFLFDIQKMKECGVMKFRDTIHWSYDVGSWMTEQIFENGFKHIQIDRKPGSIDFDVIGMDYGWYRHFGKMSWSLSHHIDRIDEVKMRLKFVEEELKKYEDIDLKGKFI